MIALLPINLEALSLIGAGITDQEFSLLVFPYFV